MGAATDVDVGTGRAEYVKMGGMETRVDSELAEEELVRAPKRQVSSASNRLGFYLTSSSCALRRRQDGGSCNHDRRSWQ